jgi:hypothetical protein
MTNQALGVHSIGQYMKVVLSTRNTMTNQALGVHSIGQYMKLFLPKFGIVPNQVFLIVNNKTNYLATFESCIF